MFLHTYPYMELISSARPIPTSGSRHSYETHGNVPVTSNRVRMAAGEGDTIDPIAVVIHILQNPLSLFVYGFQGTS